jgi:hypothetical protein
MDRQAVHQEFSWMESFHLLADIIIFLDMLSQRPLSRVVPDLDQLLAEPASFLRSREVTIGPWRRFGTVFTLGIPGLALAASPIVVGHLLFQENSIGWREFSIFWLIGVGAILGVIWSLVRLRGGSCVLTPQGVEMHYRSVVVSCPWSVFNSAGRAVIAGPFGQNQLELPVAASAATDVEARKHGSVISTGIQVKTPQLKFRSNDEIILKGLYCIPLADLGWLLQRMGSELGEAKSSVATVTSAPVPKEAAKAEGDDWFRVSLTRLSFPPQCCRCGASTEESSEFRGYLSLTTMITSAQLNSPECIRVWIPLCGSCRKATARRFRNLVVRCVLMGGLIGAATGWALGSANAQAGNGTLLFVVLVGGAGSWLGWFFGTRWARKMTAPVELRDYRPREGTVRIRFRENPGYGVQTLGLGEN